MVIKSDDDVKKLEGKVICRVNDRDYDAYMKLGELLSSFESPVGDELMRFNISVEDDICVCHFTGYHSTSPSYLVDIKSGGRLLSEGETIKVYESWEETPVVESLRENKKNINNFLNAI